MSATADDTEAVAASITPRHDQLEAHDAVLDALASGMRRPLVEAPCAWGKSVLIGMLALTLVRRGQRVLILAHRHELLEQNTGALLRLDPEADVGICSASCFVQRINMVRASPATASRSDVDVKGVDKINAAITALTKRENRRYTTTQDGGEIIRQTEQDGRDFATITDYGPGFQGTCSKLHGTHARYALILHMLDDPDNEIIPTETVERARILVREFLLPQARDFFASLAGSQQQRLRDAAGWLLTKAPPRFLASDVTSGVWACRGIATKELNDLLDPLVTGGWIEPETPFPSNRAWAMHPNLRVAFAERAETERTRREDARRLFLRLRRKRTDQSGGDS